MADLDDFFAKKDKKKSKTTKKFSTTDEVAKKLEDTAKKVEKPVKKERPEGEESNPDVPEQDEWREFEEEKKDYTGLKIGNLTINPAQDAANNDNNGEQQLGYEDGMQDGERKPSGPWKKVESEGQAVPQEVAPPKEKKPAEVIVKSGAYVPPSMRGGSAQSREPMSHNQRLKMGTMTKAAPDVHNEDLFPTLSKSNDQKRHKNEGSFEVVQHTRSSGVYRPPDMRGSGQQGAKLTLGNRYNTLSHDS